MDEPEHLLDLTKSESQWLHQYLDTLPAEAWSKPSACDAWEVRDVVGHLVWVAEFYTDVISRGLQGDTSPSEDFHSVDLADRSAFFQFLADTAVDRRKNLGDQLLPTFITRWWQTYLLVPTKWCAV